MKKENKSEAERMVKAIQHILYENYSDAAIIEGVEIAEIVTWLEKQKEHFHDQCNQCELNRDTVFHKGMQYAVEQMKKEAIDGEICKRYSGALTPATNRAIDESKFHFGDKVKIYIFKDENNKD